MSDQDFDDFIKQKLHEHASPVAKDMWQRIQTTRHKRRGVAWRKSIKGMAVGIVAFLLIASVYFFNNHGQQNIVEAAEQNTVAIEPGSHLKMQEEKIKKNSQADNTIPPAVIGATENDETNFAANNKKFVTDKAKQKDILPQKDNEFNHQSGKATNTERITSATFLHQKNKNKIMADMAEISSTKNATQLMPDETIANNIPANIWEEEYKTTRWNALALLARQQAVELNKTSQKELADQLQFMPITDCPTSDYSRSDWYLEVFAAPDYAIKRMQGIDNEYLRRKDSSENFRSAFTAGIRISKNIGENLMLKTGLQYSQINEKFDFRSENERQTITVVTVRTIVRAPGDTVFISDTSTIQQIGYRQVTTYNKYRSFDIPLIIGYEWGNESFKTSINTGVIFNLQSWQQGDMLDTAYNPVAFDKDNQVFKQNIGLGIYASVAFLKSIGAKSELFAEPYFRYNISNMTNSSSPFNQRFHIAGLNLGIRYKINSSRQQ